MSIGPSFDTSALRIRLKAEEDKVKAFGMNHSEQILRLSEIQSDYIQKPMNV